MCGDDSSIAADREGCLETLVRIVGGPLGKAGQRLHGQTCCHQHIVSRKEQAGRDLCVVCRSLQHAIIQECLPSSDNRVCEGNRFVGLGLPALLSAVASRPYWCLFTCEVEPFVPFKMSFLSLSKTTLLIVHRAKISLKAEVCPKSHTCALNT